MQYSTSVAEVEKQLCGRLRVIIYPVHEVSMRNSDPSAVLMEYSASVAAQRLESTVVWGSQ
eukprot:26786-Eustigmatos_ZCMA.PRE.1